VSYARDLLAELHAAGLAVTADGDRLVIRPGSRLTASLRERARTHKAALLDLLGGRAEPPVEPTAWRWRLSFPDGAVLDLRCLPEATRGELLSEYPGAVDAEPLAEVCAAALGDDEADELQQMVEQLAERHGCPPDEQALMLAEALADPAAALRAFRRMLAEPAHVHVSDHTSDRPPPVTVH
jgi:hypothetical protein